MKDKRPTPNAIRELAAYAESNAEELTLGTSPDARLGTRLIATAEWLRRNSHCIARVLREKGVPP